MRIAAKHWRPNLCESEGPRALQIRTFFGRNSRPTLDGFERSDAREPGLVVRAGVHPFPSVEHEGLERAGFRVDDPMVSDSLLGLDVALLDAVVRFVRFRQHLANPIGHDGPTRRPKNVGRGRREQRKTAARRSC